MDTTQIGAEYINANYIRQPSETEQCDMNSSSTENLSASLCAACTFAQQQKNCQNCQLLNKTCVQCAMKSAIIPLNGNCTNCGKKTEVGSNSSRFIWIFNKTATFHSRFFFFLLILALATCMFALPSFHQWWNPIIIFFTLYIQSWRYNVTLLLTPVCNDEKRRFLLCKHVSRHIHP